MKYGTVIRLLTVACLAIVQLTGCSSDVEEMEEAAPGIPIRIVAEMNRGGGTSRMVGVPARLSGEWKDGIKISSNPFNIQWDDVYLGANYE